ncbi:MAG: hypothetical protein ACREQ5_26860, partial [Candidatus Dormibacteria bacterium]
MAVIRYRTSSWFDRARARRLALATVGLVAAVAATGCGGSRLSHDLLLAEAGVAPATAGDGAAQGTAGAGLSPGSVTLGGTPAQQVSS